MNKTKIVKEFELMRNTAELKALSNLSLKQQLTDKQHKRMIELSKEV